MGDNRYRKGGPEDDVSQNIRSQQQADGAPSRKEAKSSARKQLAEDGCQHCDEDDPDELERYALDLPSCSAVQSPPDQFVVLCDDHADSRKTPRERALKQAREYNEAEWRETKAIAVAFFDCQNYSFVDEGQKPTTTEEVQVGLDGDEPIMEEQEMELPGGPVTTLDTECRCGASLTEVVVLDD